MNILIPSDDNLAKQTQHKAEVLNEMELYVAELMEEHSRKRRLWFPSDFLPADEQMDEDEHRLLAKLRDRARGITDAIRVSVVLNLITEEGLPHFHRLLDRYLGADSFWSKWNFMWTAEEDRHGCVLRDYARDARLFRQREVEMMQYAYQEAGFTPEWDRDPYRVFVYTTLQERATQFSHRNTGKQVGDDEPLLKNILNNVAADEAKHYTFYRKVFDRILQLDPNRALESALEIMPSLSMPGASMPAFRDMADIVRRVGIYGPWDYKSIVEEAIRLWKIELMTGLNEAGRIAQEKILEIPKRLQKVAEYIERRSSHKSFSFEFIYNRQFALE